MALTKKILPKNPLEQMIAATEILYGRVFTIKGCCISVSTPFKGLLCLAKWLAKIMDKTNKIKEGAKIKIQEC